MSEQPNAAAIAERLEQEAADIMRAAEEILWNAEDANSFTPSQLTVLRAAGLADRNTLESELGRIRSVRNHIATAGPNSVYAAANERLTAAAEQHKLLRPELERTIREAQAKLQELETELRLATADVDRRREARETLRSDQLLPHFAREQLKFFNRCSCTSIRQEIASCDSRIRLIKQVQELAPGSDAALLYAKNVDRENAGDPSYLPLAIKKETDRAISYELPAMNLESHKRELLLELPQVEMHRAKAVAELKRLQESQSGVRDWYIVRLAD